MLFLWVDAGKDGAPVVRDIQKFQHFPVYRRGPRNEVFEKDDENLLSGKDIEEPLDLFTEHPDVSILQKLGDTTTLRQKPALKTLFLQFPRA